MNIKKFNDEILAILKNGEIENISLENIETLEYIILDDDINKELYTKFKDNYLNLYGDDLNDFYCKLQDMVYRINLLVNNNLIDKRDIDDIDKIKEITSKAIDYDSASFLDAVSYDQNDNEIIEEQESIINEVLDEKKDMAFIC